MSAPSAINRRRSHPPQKCSVMDVTKDTLPAAPSRRKFLATSEGGAARRRRGVSGKAAST